MSYLADDIADYLATQNCGTVATDIYTGRLPDTPDACLAVIERPGAPPLMTLTGGTLAELKIDRPMIQIRIRATSYNTGQVLAHKVFKALQGLTEVTLGGSLIHLMEAVQSPAHIGLDEKQRDEWSQNFALHYENPNR